jgi:hypothetical protein
MRVLTFLPRGGLELAIRQLPSLAIVRCSGASDVRAAIGEGGGGVAVIDPSELRDDAFATLLDSIFESGFPLILFVDLNEQSAARVLQAAHLMPVEVLVRRAEGEADLFRRLVAGGGRPTVPALVLRSLGAYRTSSSAAREANSRDVRRDADSILGA